VSGKSRSVTRRDAFRCRATTGPRAPGADAPGRTWVDGRSIRSTGADALAVRGAGGAPFPTSPFILKPYQQELPVLPALRPGWRDAEGTVIPGSGVYSPAGSYPAGTWTVRRSMQFGPGFVPPGPGKGQQDALGDRPGNHAREQPRWGIPNAGTHQLWTSGSGVTDLDLRLPDPLLYHVRLRVSVASFTSSPVVNIDANGTPLRLPPGSSPSLAGFGTLEGAQVPAYLLPPSTIYGFNGTFPGPLINMEYGRPALVRFENDLDLNPFCRDRQDFGAPDWAFLAHLHNGHTAPESDGQPHHMVDNEGGYLPMEWVDNLYLAHPAGGDDREKQSFLWYHDHRLHHAAANVYKGLLGVAPHYDPVLDPGDERAGLRLPGIRVDNGDGSFDVEYDVSFAFHDCRLDDGVTPHGGGQAPALAAGVPPSHAQGDTRPEWWGQLFYGRYPDHGFAGDVFTVNGVAYPVMHVYQRRYRLRYLDASVSRQYVLQLMQGTPHPFPGQQGQWNFGLADGDGNASRARGACVMRQTEIATDGGLLPTPLEQDAIEIWPGKRREVVVDFTRYRDGTPTTPGDVLYLTNTAFMPDGRRQVQDERYAVPLVRIVIVGPPPEADHSLMPVAGKTPLRAAPPFDPEAARSRDFTLQRGRPSGGPGAETGWLVNGLEFDPRSPVATPILDSAEAWGINDGAGDCAHAIHLHMEEHHVVWRSTQLPKHADDAGKEDVVALEPDERTIVFRRFRTFLGNYVAHCHDLGREDGDAMFGWSVVKRR
jgi:FtsP/CotA-like multicopper oxidase with cupredoxin domain